MLKKVNVLDTVITVAAIALCFITFIYTIKSATAEHTQASLAIIIEPELVLHISTDDAVFDDNGDILGKIVTVYTAGRHAVVEINVNTDKAGYKIGQPLKLHTKGVSISGSVYSVEPVADK